MWHMQISATIKNQSGKEVCPENFRSQRDRKKNSVEQKKKKY